MSGNRVKRWFKSRKSPSPNLTPEAREVSEEVQKGTTRPPRGIFSLLRSAIFKPPTPRPPYQPPRPATPYYPDRRAPSVDSFASLFHDKPTFNPNQSSLGSGSEPLRSLSRRSNLHDLLSQFKPLRVDHTKDIPLEILTLICANTKSMSDRKALRFVSRKWAKAAAPALFGIYRLRLTPRSLRGMTSFSQSELRKHLRLIVFNGRAVDPQFARWFDVAKLKEIGAGEDHLADARQSAPDSWPECKLKGRELRLAIQAYNDCLQTQEQLFEDDRWVKTLADILPSFTGISMLMCDNFNVHGGPGSLFLENSLKPGPEGRYLDLVRLLDRTLPKGQLEEVHLDWLNTRGWNSKASREEDADNSFVRRDLFAHVKCLSLEFQDIDAVDGEVARLGPEVCGAKSVVNLRLCFSPDFLNEAPYRVRMLIPENTFWPNLNFLHLHGFETTEVALTNLLRQHSGTLRMLDLSCIKFSNSKPSGMPLKDYSPGYWVSFMHFLNKEMSLESVAFVGEFDNSWDEAWSGPRKQCSCPHICLTQKIRMFATGSLVHKPFTRRQVGCEDGKKAGVHGMLPWLYDANDLCWVFRADLLKPLPAG